MEDYKPKKKKRINSPMALIPIIAGVLINFLLSKFVIQMQFPLYLDNIGTICASVLGGFLPGIFTGVANNLINYTIDATSIYYAGISALMAIVAVIFFKKGYLKKISGVITFILVLGVIGGVGGGIISWFLYGPTSDGMAGECLSWLCDSVGLNILWAHMVTTFIFDLLDKTITVLISLIILKLIPERLKKSFWFSGWKQTPVTVEEGSTGSIAKKGRHSLNTRIGVMLIFATLSMALIVTGVSSSLFREYSKEQHTKTAIGTAQLAGKSLDPEMVDEYIKKGEKAKGYKKVKKELYAIRDSSPDIEYVYVYRIEKDGCRVVFDLDTTELEGSKPGELIEFDDSFKPYLDDLLAGKKIAPIESDDTYGWLLTVYSPVYDSKGKCVCYAAADVKMDGIKTYEEEFAIKVILLFMGFFILILVIGLWLSKYHFILPVNSMASRARAFADSNDRGNEQDIEDNMKKILALEIRTGDEVQNLYESFCRMTETTVSHMKNIHRQSEKISELQNGLIITMADMVEGRDSDTGNHVYKTAAYTRIIMESLKRKGYYAEQLTDEFIDNVVQSAPLHDIGKISISDVILNKPGKLTDEEFSIMQTHTTAGKEMIDQVIETVDGESYLKEGRNLAAYHHEKWNGKGYPVGLSGEDIPLEARVMAIADVFDALSSKRVYKDAMPFEKAVSIIQEDSGTHFDPKCVEAFVDSLDEIKEVLDYYNELESEGITAKEKEKEKEQVDRQIKR